MVCGLTQSATQAYSVAVGVRCRTFFTNLCYDDEHMPLKKQTSWGKVADWYDKHLEQQQQTYQQTVILPNVLRLMQIQEGERIVDIACGQGFFAREFHAAGAHVTGTDISPELIALAKKESRIFAKELQFHVAPADVLTPITDSSAEKITLILALQNIENLSGVMSECSRILAPHGSVHIVLNHPAFRIPKHSSWGWDITAHSQYRRIEKYLSESRAAIDMHPGSSASNNAKQQTTVSFHRPLQSYFKHATKTGFSVTRLEEWISSKQSQPGPRAQMENTARKEFPLFLYLELQKQ